MFLEIEMLLEAAFNSQVFGKRQIVNDDLPFAKKYSFLTTARFYQTILMLLMVRLTAIILIQPECGSRLQYELLS
jgi:hypothetical protein